MKHPARLFIALSIGFIISIFVAAYMGHYFHNLARGGVFFWWDAPLCATIVLGILALSAYIGDRIS